MKKTVLSQLDASMVKYFTELGLTEKDFWCTECGKCLVDIKDLKKFRCITKRKHKDLPIKNPYLIKIDGEETIRINGNFEPEEYRWLLRGKYLSESNKRVFRHICWDCFFKMLPNIVDIKRAARKSKWYKLIMEGNKPIPLGSIASSDYFKLLFDLTDEEIKAEKIKLATASLEKFVRKYGPKEGKKKYDAYCARQAYTCSKEYMKETRGWSDKQWNEFNASRASTEENFIKRYGEKAGKRKWQEYCAHEAYAGKALEYFIELYGKEVGQKKYLEVNAKKTISLENFIRKYGEDVGKIKFDAVKNKSFSNKSQILFKEIDKRLGKLSVNSKFAVKNNEETLYLFFDDGTCRICHPDYILNTHIIEFNGDYWHANPTIYKSNEEIVMYGNSISVKAIWEADKKRLQGIEKLGYKVFVVWESEYDDNPEKVISDCIAFLGK